MKNRRNKNGIKNEVYERNKEEEEGERGNNYFATGVGDDDVHLRGSGGDNLSIERCLGQIDLNTSSLVDSDGGNLLLDLRNKTKKHETKDREESNRADLNFDTLTVHHLASGHQLVKHHTALFAAVDSNAVDLALDNDDSILALSNSEMRQTRAREKERSPCRCRQSDSCQCF